MSHSPELDLGYVRAQFPGLSRGWTLFDSAGGSQIAQQAVDRITSYLYERNVQIGGSYQVSLDAAEALHQGREAAATLVNATRPEEIVFGPSSTVLLQNLARAMESQLSPGDEIIVTISDHESNIGPWERLKARGVVLKFWPLERDSYHLDLEKLDRIMTSRTRLVCVPHVSNILGVVNPIREIADFVHSRGVLLCVDGVAYAPHHLIDVQDFGADYYVFSLYKVFGPHFALMYGRYDLLRELDSLYHYFYGKEIVPGKLEPGNPNYELAYSTCGVVDYLASLAGQGGGMNDRTEGPTTRARLVQAFGLIGSQEAALTERLLSYLRARNDCAIIGPRDNHDGSRVPTIAFRLDGQDASIVCKEMDAHNIAIRHGDFHARRLAEHLGITNQGGALRVSMVHYNTLDEVDRFCAALDEIGGPVA